MKKSELIQIIKEEIQKLNEAKKFNVIAKRNGKMVTFNKKPMSAKEAGDLAAELNKAKIPSVDMKSIDIVPVNESIKLNEADEPNVNYKLFITDATVQKIFGTWVGVRFKEKGFDKNKALSEWSKITKRIEQGIKQVL